MAHVSVLLQETVDGLDLRAGASVLDATFGGGGHSRLIAERIGDQGRLYALDLDRDAFTDALITGLKKKCQFHFAIESFRNLGGALDRMGAGALDAAVFDLGSSTMQLEERGRGFSFLKDEPLVMTFRSANDHPEITAEMVVNDWSEETLRDILVGFAEERFAGRIARAIAEHRKGRRIASTRELVEVIEGAVPPWYQKRKAHPATKTFQAIRMAVNDELGAIQVGIPEAFQRLKRGGRVAVITFHSIEDRMVKRLFKSLEQDEKGALMNKRPIVPTYEEVRKNPRSRSAKLRIIQKIT